MSEMFSKADLLYGRRKVNELLSNFGGAPGSPKIGRHRKLIRRGSHGALLPLVRRGDDELSFGPQEKAMEWRAYSSGRPYHTFQCYNFRASISRKGRDARVEIVYDCDRGLNGQKFNSNRHIRRARTWAGRHLVWKVFLLDSKGAPVANGRIDRFGRWRWNCTKKSLILDKRHRRDVSNVSDEWFNEIHGVLIRPTHRSFWIERCR